MIKKTKQNIYYPPEKIKNIFDCYINLGIDNIKCYCDESISNFNRYCKLLARTLIDCIFSLFNYSTIGEMSHFFTDYEDIPTPSTLRQKRKLMDPNIFKCINSLFGNSFDNYMTINGYCILAQDGYDVNIPFMNDEINAENSDSKSFWQYQVNAHTIVLIIFL